jgi:cysteine-rich repeat protein
MFWKTALIISFFLIVPGAGGCTGFADPAKCSNGLRCPVGTICAANQDICIATPCGDGIVDIGEKCDDGNLMPGDGCSPDCTSDESCGNGVLDRDVGEVCDDRNEVSWDGCSADCTSNEMCGDGVVNELAGEQCDDGGNSADCDADCTAVSCGDNFVNSIAGEQCDPPSQTCSQNCLRVNCGDRLKDPGEDCDEGGVNTATCDADCTVPACGDGVHNARAAEPCDDGGQDTVTCDGDCTLPTCGDGWWNPAASEQCDTAGNSSGCDQNCTLALCGDQFINPVAGEECDDGNLVNTDECTVICEPPHCSDGFQNADERDVDCGGHCGSHSCEMLQSCSASEDCMAGVCLGGTCVPDWSRLATGRYHTCALLYTGAVRCWGRGESGQLGYGNTNNIGDDEVPASIGYVNVGGTVVQLAAGDSHTCALLDSGAVRCWGDGFYGQLGYGNSNDIGDNEAPASASDVNVGGTVVQIVAGGVHTCALLDTGAVRCWGGGFSGRLGYGNTNNIGDNEAPALAGNVNVGGTVVQLAAGTSHTCALLDSGTVRCWGLGLYGRLGYGNANNIGDNEVPASVGDVTVGGTVIQIAAGEYHTCALLDIGAVRCWGSGDNGRLGYGNTDTIGDNDSPASAGDVNVGGTVTQIAAGGSHTCTVLNTGLVRCWGVGGWGALGYGNPYSIGDDEVPASAGNVNVGGDVTQIATGNLHTCALRDTGAVLCWGWGSYGQLGYGNTNSIGDNETPASAGSVNLGGTAIHIAAGGSHTCALFDSGAVRCWGGGGNGQLGYGDTSRIGDNEAPASAGNVSVGGPVVQLDASRGQHTCAVLDSGAVRCWGWGSSGQLGYGNTDSIGDNEAPASAGNVNVGGTVIQIAAGWTHTCARLNTGTVRCWGEGGNGELGYGNTDSIGDNEAPVSAGNVNVGGTVIQIAAGHAYTCALLANGAVRCWGSGSSGKLGYSNTNNIGDNEVPTLVGNVNVGGTVIQIAAGWTHTCALLATGGVRCWGEGDHGKLGYGNTNDIGDNEVPASAGDVNVGGTVIQIAAGSAHTCALLNTGVIRCWGSGYSGQLGYGNINNIGDNESPASAGDVNVGGTVTKIAAGGSQTCALLDTGAIRCWGDSYDGQLGYGNMDTIGDNESPASVGDVNVGGYILESTAISEHTCGLLDTTDAHCWSGGATFSTEPEPADHLDIDGFILQGATSV